MCADTNIATGSPPHRICLTGSAGAIGRVVAPALLARGHFLRGVDRHASPDVTESIVGDLRDATTVEKCVAGVDTVIHLAATPDVSDFLTDLLPNNIVATYNLLEQAGRAGVKRVLLASTFRVVAGAVTHGQMATAATLPAPRDYYALTKICAEQLGHLAAHRSGLEVIAIRLGWLPRTMIDAKKIAQSADHQALYLSHQDCRQFFVRAVETPWPADMKDRFQIIYAFSAGATERYDHTLAARLINYLSQDIFPAGLDVPLPSSAQHTRNCSPHNAAPTRCDQLFP